MKISVITTTYNSESGIEKNVRSVFSQKYNNFEHIIIDNLSTDKTPEIITEVYSEFDMTDHLTIISEKDKGIGDAFNKGIGIATGDILTILNSDDYYYHNNVFHQIINEFKTNRCLFVHGDIYDFDPIYGSIIRFPSGNSMAMGMIYNHPTIFFDRYVYDKYGLFDTKYKYAMDFEFLCRLEKQIPNFHQKGKYLQGDPLVFMKYGGNSWINANDALLETKAALKNYGLWSFKSFYYNRKNFLKIKTKRLFVRLNLSKLIKFIRFKKWKYFHPNPLDII